VSFLTLSTHISLLCSDQFLEENFFDSQSASVLFDQIVATPPQLLLTFVAVTMSRHALTTIPSAWKQAWSLLATTTADSWRFWPLSMYLL
jgi:hypothetical protein